VERGRVNCKWGFCDTDLPEAGTHLIAKKRKEDIGVQATGGRSNSRRGINDGDLKNRIDREGTSLKMGGAIWGQRERGRNKQGRRNST